MLQRLWNFYPAFNWLFHGCHPSKIFKELNKWSNNICEIIFVGILFKFTFFYPQWFRYKIKSVWKNNRMELIQKHVFVMLMRNFELYNHVNKWALKDISKILLMSRIYHDLCNYWGMTNDVPMAWFAFASGKKYKRASFNIQNCLIQWLPL